MSKKTIFIFAYYSFKDPVFQSAVLPYFIGFPHKDEYRFVILTFEQEKYGIDENEEQIIRANLKEENIIWHKTRWHSGQFKLLKKGFDFFYGLAFSWLLILKYKAQIIYSEGFPGAIMGHFLSMISRRFHIIHTFEPHADYMVEAGVWKNTSWEPRLLYWLEPIIARRATVLMTATEAMKEKLELLVSQKTSVTRVPSCVEMSHFNFSEKKREELRRQLDISDDCIVLVYIGKFGGMYMDDEIFQLFQICEASGSSFQYWIFTTEDHAAVFDKFRKSGINNNRYLVKKLHRDEVPDYLSAADFGLVPVRQFPSKRYCSPIKDGEYWACGLPIIIPHGISDDYKIANEEKIGLTFKNTSHSSFNDLVRRILDYQSEENDSIRDRCRSFAMRDRSTEQYKRIFHTTFQQLLP